MKADLLHRVGSWLPMFTVGLVLGILVVPRERAFACQICFPVPRLSVADHLIGADVVVLARENPERPFSLLAVEVLKGELEEPQIDLFLDSRSRRALSLDAARKIVCVRGGETEADGWLRVAMTDATGLYQPLLREVLELAAGWQENPAQRARFFGRFLGHADAPLRELAHLEVARASYGEIKTCAHLLPPDELRSFLSDFRYAEWHALYILFLAQTGEEQDQRRIREALRTAADLGTTLQLAAWATAAIEIDGADAVGLLEKRYLRESGRSRKELVAIVSALSLHGTNGHVHLRDRIVEAYRLLLGNHPGMAPEVVADLRRWQRGGLVGEVQAIVANQNGVAFELEELLELRAYARSGSVAAATPPDRVSGTPSASVPRPVTGGLVGLVLLVLALLWMGRPRTR